MDLKATKGVIGMKLKKDVTVIKRMPTNYEVEQLLERRKRRKIVFCITAICLLFGMSIAII